MAGLELRFLGDFALLRDGHPLPLPPSRKTRALLAYLCLQPRRLLRSQLCELLWEVPDDPRGSLRWSLSKIRGLVDDEQHERVVADRSSVGIEPVDALIDICELRAIASGSLPAMPIERLEQVAARFRGNFLEGLEFSGFHAFHAWCMACRQQALDDRAAVLKTLVERLAGQPQRALPHARALVTLFPYEEEHRATLIRLLGAARQPDEAAEQYQLGLRMLKEVGVVSTGALLAARRMPRSDPAPAAPTPADPAVASPAAAPTPLPTSRRLIGRATETALIARTLAEVTETSRAAVLLVSGPPGIGKSRVLETALALARASDALVLQAAAFESDAIRPFSLWIDALRALDPTLHDAVFGGADTDNRDRLFAGLSRLVAERATERPVVVLLDDTQWCDESSAAALHYVARTNMDRRVLGVLAVRDGELQDNAALQQALRGLRRDGLLRELELGPLAADALVTLIDEQVPGADSARLSGACGGNPLLAIELARAERAGHAGRSLDDLVRERVERLSVVGAEVLRWAAVLSPRLDVGTLVRVSGIDAGEVGAALEVAERHAILRAAEQGPRFAHDLIARAIYTELSPLRRQVMHRRIAELLEQDTAQDLARAADLAHHARQSGDRGLAARAMVSAGRLCLRFFANDEALSLARSGLQLAGALPDADRVRVEIDLHDILLAAGPLDDWEAAARTYAALAEQALDRGALAHARLGYHMAALVRWQHGHWNAAREQTLQSLRAVRGGQDEARIVGAAETAKCLLLIERDLAQADAMLMEASALARRKGLVHHALPLAIGMLRFRENRLDEAEERFRESRALCKADGDRVSEYQADEFLVMLDLQRGRLEAAREGCNELLMLGEKLREGSEAPFARALLGLCNYAIDDEPEGLDAALPDLRIADAKHRLAYVLTRAAIIDCEHGRNDRAVARASEALEYATRLERASEMLVANAVLAHACAALGRRRESMAHAREAERLADDGAAVWARDLARRWTEARVGATHGGSR